jgi:hypothetical protein
MTEQTIIEKLDRLADMQAQSDAMELHYADLRKSIIPPEIQAQLDEIDAEADAAHENANMGMAALQEEIKAEILLAGTSVKGAHLYAIYGKGRVSWDTKGLDGAIVLFPELAKFRKEGQPSVSFRKV